MKRLVDVALAAALLVISAPILAALSIAVISDSGLPVLYHQKRVGRNGRTFSIVKLRTMTPGSGPRITSAGDPRITPLGKWLRRTRLDELPQLWNVLRGDMSLVGPRPEVPEWIDAIPAPLLESILTVRPGITGPSQLRGLDEEGELAASDDPEETYRSVILPRKAALDAVYARERTLGGDLQILWATARSLCRGEGGLG